MSLADAEPQNPKHKTTLNPKPYILLFPWAKFMVVAWPGAMGPITFSQFMNTTLVLLCLLPSPVVAWHLLILVTTTPRVFRGG